MTASNAAFAFAAYAVAWVGLFGYLFLLMRRLRGVEDDVRELDEYAKRAAGS